jgi:sugar phosphate isomerase/epimerase
MDAPSLEITLIGAPDDPPLNTPAYQAALREFEQALTSHGLEVSYTLEVREAWTPEPTPALYLGDFFIKLAGTVGAPLIAGIAGWLAGRSGRKFRLRVGDIEAEAPTMQAVETLIARAQEIQQTN